MFFSKAIGKTLKLGVLNFTTRVLQYPQNLHFPQPFSLFALKLIWLLVASSWRFGLECGVCMREPQETVGLPCNHIYCLTCIKNSLDAGRTSCPKCRQQLPDDFQPHVSEDIRWDLFNRLADKVFNSATVNIYMENMLFSWSQNRVVWLVGFSCSHSKVYASYYQYLLQLSWS